MIVQVIDLLIEISLVDVIVKIIYFNLENTYMYMYMRVKDEWKINAFILPKNMDFLSERFFLSSL